MDNKIKKRKIIIEVSLKLFVERGFHGTPTSLIAKEAGIATGTLFNYFKTKDILINEIYIELELEQKNWIIKDLDMEKTPKKKLKKVWNNLIIWGIDNPQKRKFGRYFGDSSFISDNTKIEIHKNYEFILDIFTKFTEKKNKKNTNAMILIFNFIGACIFTGKYLYEMKESYNEELSNESFERFCKGIEMTDED
jgi:AcrR family transcriptional regulator